jgi:hypothetical protein
LKIRFFQEIYEKYSRLNFAKEWDRSEGMAGLERRLVQAFTTRGRYGVLDSITDFDSFFGRSLLWQRDEEAVAMLPRIKYVENGRTPVPSWSWMAVMGSIKYVNVEFGMTDWSEDVKSPFTEGLGVEQDGFTVQPVGELTAMAKDFKPKDEAKLLMDRPSETEAKRRHLKCVVIGVEKLSIPSKSQKYYVLIVSPVQGKDSSNDYERVGISILTREEVEFERPGIDVRIV